MLGCPVVCRRRGATLSVVTLTVEYDREVDGRWIAEVSELPGALAYGRTRKEALANVQAIASRMRAYRDDATEPRSHRSR
jgi:hypothetical protein